MTVLTENKTTFFNRLRHRIAPSELLRVRLAYYMAKFGHRSQVRKETDAEGRQVRYFEHVRRVAIVVMDQFKIYDPDVIITALLHDALEDTDAIDAQMIEHAFGTEVARNVLNLTKVPDDFSNGYLRRLQNAPQNAKIVKCADRIDNLRSLSQTTKEFQTKQLRETYEKYDSLFAIAFPSETRFREYYKIFSLTLFEASEECGYEYYGD